MALSFYKKACDLGDDQGCVEYAFETAAEKPGEYYQLFVDACERGYGLGCYGAGLYIADIEKNAKKSGAEESKRTDREYYTLGCELDDSFSCWSLAVDMLINRSQLTEQQISSAFSIGRKAFGLAIEQCSKGDSWACAYAANIAFDESCFQAGQNSCLDKNLISVDQANALGVKYSLKACWMGNAYGCEIPARVYPTSLDDRLQDNPYKAHLASLNWMHCASAETEHDGYASCPKVADWFQEKCLSGEQESCISGKPALRQSCELVSSPMLCDQLLEEAEYATAGFAKTLTNARLAVALEAIAIAVGGEFNDFSGTLRDRREFNKSVDVAVSTWHVANDRPAQSDLTEVQKQELMCSAGFGSYCQTLCDHKNPLGCRELAILNKGEYKIDLEKTRFRKMNREARGQADALLAEACNLGDKKACFYDYFYRSEGRSSEPKLDKARAIDLFIDLCRDGENSSCRFLGFYFALENSNFDNALKEKLLALMTTACEKADVIACAIQEYASTTLMLLPYELSQDLLQPLVKQAGTACGVDDNHIDCLFHLYVILQMLQAAEKTGSNTRADIKDEVLDLTLGACVSGHEESCSVLDDYKKVLGLNDDNLPSIFLAMDCANGFYDEKSCVMLAEKLRESVDNYCLKSTDFPGKCENKNLELPSPEFCKNKPRYCRQLAHAYQKLVQPRLAMALLSGTYQFSQMVLEATGKERQTIDFPDTGTSFNQHDAFYYLSLSGGGDYESFRKFPGENSTHARGEWYVSEDKIQVRQIDSGEPCIQELAFKLVKDRLSQFDDKSECTSGYIRIELNDGVRITDTVSDVMAKRQQFAVESNQADELKLNLKPQERIDVQKRLIDLGFNVGSVDGVWGQNTRSAIKNWQKTQKLYSTGFLPEQQYHRLLYTGKPISR